MSETISKFWAISSEDLYHWSSGNLSLQQFRMVPGLDTATEQCHCWGWIDWLLLDLKKPLSASLSLLLLCSLENSLGCATAAWLKKLPVAVFFPNEWTLLSRPFSLFISAWKQSLQLSLLSYLVLDGSYRYSPKIVNVSSSSKSDAASISSQPPILIISEMKPHAFYSHVLTNSNNLSYAILK